MKKLFRSLLLFVLFYTGLQSGTSQCTLSNLSVDVGDCIEANVYSFTLDFNVANNPSPLFELYMNGSYYGVYNIEELPLTIESFPGSASGQDTLLVCMDGTDNCCGDAILESPCQCNFFNIDVEMAGCTEDSLWFQLDFSYVQVSDSFLLGTPGFFIGTFGLDQLPLLVGPFPRSLCPAEILLTAQNDIFCFEPFILNDDECDQCLITAVEADPGDCNDDGQFYVTLSFQHMNTSSEGYRVRGNGHLYGEFEYTNSELLDNGLYLETLSIGPLNGDCETIYEFVVLDNVHEDCSNFTSIDPVCCEGLCDIRDISVSEIECDSPESISFYLDFIYENAENNFFEVYAGDQLIGTYLLSGLPLYLEDFPLGAEATVLTVCINDQENCCETVTLEVPDCGGEECMIYDLSVYEVECQSEESIGFLLNFEHYLAGNDFYEVYANDQLIGYYPLEQLPMWISDFPIHEEGTFLTICINDQENCCETVQIEVPDCTGFGCEIGEINYDIEFFNIDSFLVILSFNHNNDDMEQFSVNGNGVYYGEFLYGSLPIYLGPYNCHDSIFLEYVVRDLTNGDCKSVLELGVVGCPMNNIETDPGTLDLYVKDQQLWIIDTSNLMEEYHQLRLIHSGGQVLLSRTLSGHQAQYQIDLPFLPSGMYFAELTGKTQRMVYRIPVLH